MTLMTYGTLPTFEEFDKAFDRECPEGLYNIHLGYSDSRATDGFRLGSGDWSPSQLWSAINEIVTFEGDDITVSEDEEYEDVYQVFYPGTDRAYVEIGPGPSDLLEWAEKFRDTNAEMSQALSIGRARECLAYAAAYGVVGKCYARKDAAMDLVSAIMGTLGFEWI